MHLETVPFLLSILLVVRDSDTRDAATRVWDSYVSTSPLMGHVFAVLFRLKVVLYIYFLKHQTLTLKHRFKSKKVPQKT